MDLNYIGIKINAIHIQYYILINIFIFFLYLENKLKLKCSHRPLLGTVPSGQTRFEPQTLGF